MATPRYFQIKISAHAPFLPLNIGEFFVIVKEDLREFRKGLTFFMPYYRLPSCKSRCILKRAADFCSRNDVNLTLGYALQLVGREDADEIYDNSLKYFSYFRETLHSASQFGHNLYFVKRHYQEYL